MCSVPIIIAKETFTSATGAAPSLPITLCTAPQDGMYRITVAGFDTTMVADTGYVDTIPVSLSFGHTNAVGTRILTISNTYPPVTAFIASSGTSIQLTAVTAYSDAYTATIVVEAL